MLIIGLNVLYLGVLWILWDEKRQGWHDKVVDSVVVDVGPHRRLNPLAFFGHVLRTRAG